MQCPRRTLLSVSELIVDKAGRLLMPALIVVRRDTCSETIHKTEVRQEVTLSLGLTHKVK